MAGYLEIDDEFRRAPRWKLFASNSEQCHRWQQAGVSAPLAMSLLFYTLNVATGLIGGVLYAFEGTRGMWGIEDEFRECLNPIVEVLRINIPIYGRCTRAVVLCGRERLLGEIASTRCNTLATLRHVRLEKDLKSALVG